MTYTNFLHNKVGKDEWSGILFYEVEGSIHDLDNLVFKANKFMLKDIGSSAYTEYEFDETIMDYIDANPEVEEMKMGMMHSHHNMSNYFSGTDMEELEENTEHHNYYLSLIVSFDCNYTAKLAFRGASQKILVKGDDGKLTEISISSSKEEVVYLCDVDIVMDISEFDHNQYLALEKEKEKARKAKEKAKESNKNKFGGYGGAYGPYGYSQKTTKTVTTKTDKNKTIFNDSRLLQKAISSLVLFDVNDQHDINMFVALHTVSNHYPTYTPELQNYIDAIEDILSEVVSRYFGISSTDDVTEFCDNALDELGNIEKTPFIESFIEMLEINSSLYEQICEEDFL